MKLLYIIFIVKRGKRKKKDECFLDVIGKILSYLNILWASNLSFAYYTFIVILSLKVSLAEKTAVLFTKDGDQHNNLYDMQCMWYASGN